ncbi:DUF418 domain-containing protein [Bacillus sp. DJP31]|uniref:DUF418 domain-containing protein n=1 Tax=Bacillus sp. DJP31 TaxID=3409789 RepID=UPI003BB780AA
MINNSMPISEKERIHSIDVIRGFAILGIFLVNMSSFHSPAMYEGSNLKLTTLDTWVTNFIDIFAQASFYTLFSFLFGFGMVIFLDRAKERGQSYKTLFIRRLLILFLFGITHAFLIWHGDILVTYSLIGFILLLFYGARAKVLLTTGLSILLVPAILLSALAIMTSFFMPDQEIVPRDEALVAESIQNYKYGSFLEITTQRMNDYFYVNNLENALFLIVSILPLFLLGAYVAKQKWFSEVKTHKKAIRTMWLISLLIGIPSKLLPYFTSKNFGTEYFQGSIGGPALALFYATSIVLLMDTQIWKRILKPFSFVGKLSLTNYLLQSIICTTLFYSYGFGFYGEVSHVQGLLLTIGIFFIQVFGSYLWLKNFQYGPMEWLWRSLTYGKVQTFKRREHNQ